MLGYWGVGHFFPLLGSLGRGCTCRDGHLSNDPISEDDTKESSAVYELKRIVQGILKRPLEDRGYTRMTSCWVTADPLETVASPVRLCNPKLQLQLT